MTATAVDVPKWQILRQRIAADVLTLPVLWAMLAAGTALVTGIVAQFATVSMSAWEVATQLPRWYAAGMGVYLTAVYLPLYIAHGVTRREFMQELPGFVLASVTGIALLITVGFALEAAIYRALGWTQGLDRPHLFDSPTEYHLVFAEHWLLFVVWMVSGALVGAGFYRRFLLGAALLPIGLIFVAVAESIAGPAAIGPNQWVAAAIGEPAVGLVAVVCVGLAALGLAATWRVVRDMPVRSKAS